MTDRFKWMRDGPGRFVAYPEGPGFPRRLAEIDYDLTQPQGFQWRWRITYDDAVNHGRVADKQAASDQANALWPEMRQQAHARAAEKRAKEEMEAMVDRQVLVGDVPIDAFQLTSSTSDRLRAIIGHGTRHFVGSGGRPLIIPTRLQPLMDACSAELYRRRVQGR